ncbi:alginate export family protein [uncultured Proteiniphilum sp.]|uniref:alginate export family protein n=1 Tax=uncultured Proteiniphilum sp. TaxID=497637 RepID=UPI00260FFE24|nr:alginate export family protein [uncultured Proteiniphilum sp.]
MQKFIVIVLLAAFTFPLPMNAQEEEKGGEFSMDINLRPRFEYRHGYSYPRLETDKASAFISNRARIGANFDNGFFSARIAAQDVSIWGQKRQNDNDGSRFTMHEAWAQMIHNGFFAKIGRQSLSYDDGRILSESSWTPTGIWHDALKVGYENAMNTLHLAFAYNQSGEKTNEGTFYEPVGQPYQNMQTLWYQYRNPNGFTASALFVNLGFEVGDPANPAQGLPADPRKAYMQTMGSNIGYKNNIWNIMGTFYYQTGTNSNDEKVSAYMLALRGRYALNSQFALYGGTEFHPGQDPDAKKVTRMDLLYRSNHSFMGSMDYFKGYDYYGVWDKYIGLQWNPWKKLKLDLRYHHFSSEQPIDVDGTEKKVLGSEIDFTFTYPIRKYIMLEGGYSFMLATDAMPIAKGRPGNPDAWQDWAYVSLTINPTIFKNRF